MLRQAVERDVNDTDAHSSLAITHQHLGRLDEARHEGDLAIGQKALAHQRERAARQCLVRRQLPPRLDQPLKWARTKALARVRNFMAHTPVLAISTLGWSNRSTHRSAVP